MHTDTDTDTHTEFEMRCNNCSNSLFCATCKMQLKTNFTSFQIADGAHKQSISRNQHQSRLKHLSQSGTRQVKAQLTAHSSAQVQFGSAQLVAAVAAVRLPHNSIKRKVNANTPRRLHAPTTTPLGQLHLSAQSVSQ